MHYSDLVALALDTPSMYNGHGQHFIGVRYSVDPKAKAVAGGLVPAAAVRMQHVRPFVTTQQERKIAYMEHGVAMDPITGRLVIDARTNMYVRSMVPRVFERWELYPDSRAGEIAGEILNVVHRAASGTYPALDTFPVPDMWLVEDQRNPLRPEIGNRYLCQLAAQRHGCTEPTPEQQIETFAQCARQTPSGMAYPQALFTRTNTHYTTCPVTGQARPSLAPIAGAEVGTWVSLNGQWFPRAQQVYAAMIELESLSVLGEGLNPALRIFQRHRLLAPQDYTPEDVDAAVYAFDGLWAGALPVWRDNHITSHTCSASLPEQEIERGKKLIDRCGLLAAMTDEFAARLMDTSPEPNQYPAPVISAAALEACVLDPRIRPVLLGAILDDFKAEVAAESPRLAKSITLSDMLRCLRAPLTEKLQLSRPVVQVVALPSAPGPDSLVWNTAWANVDLLNLAQFTEHYIPCENVSEVQGGTNVVQQASPTREKRRRGKRGGRKNREWLAQRAARAANPVSTQP